MQHQWDPQCPAPPSQAWGNRPSGCGAHQLCKGTDGRPEWEEIINGVCFWFVEKVMTA